MAGRQRPIFSYSDATLRPWTTPVTAAPPIDPSLVSREPAKPRVLVVGTGPAGLITALALVRTGAVVTLAGPDPVSRPDQRTTALFGSNIDLLEHLRIWPLLEDQATALTGLRLIDDTGNLIRAPETLFQAHELRIAAFGYNIANRNLVAACVATLARTPSIALVTANAARIEPAPAGASVTFDDGTVWCGDLVVGADGRHSPCRLAAGIATSAWAYQQTAIATQFSHSRPHDGISTELHRRPGPLTVVPMHGLQSSLVWVESPVEAQRLMALDDPAFGRALETRLQGLLGTIRNVGPRGAFPLSGLTADPIAQNRIVLVGEAAHVLPPIGAQGLNLGLRDAAWLADVVGMAVSAGHDIGGQNALAAYTDARRTDVGTRSIAVDLLNRSLLADMLPIDLLRGAGIATLSAVPWLRQQVMRHGMGQDLNQSLGRPSDRPALLQPFTARRD